MNESPHPSKPPNGPARPGLSIVFAYLRAQLIAYGPFALGTPIAVAWTSSLAIGQIARFFAFGFVFWSFFEYAVHRFIQHSPRIRRYIRRWDDHAGHHAEADDPAGFVSPLAESLPIAVVMLVLFVGIAPSWAAGVTGMAGFLLGYLMYDWIHCASHISELHADRPWLARWSLNHLRHHWERANAYYGFTSSLWDRLLGTYPSPKGPSPRPIQRQAQSGGAQSESAGANDELV
jgi:sterol desaturase/sphingolipid hydroxylase (fatty acid hydroxylase superfamily)